MFLHSKTHSAEAQSCFSRVTVHVFCSSCVVTAVRKFGFRRTIEKLRNTMTKTHVFERTYMYSPTVVVSVRDSTHAVQVDWILLRKDLLVPGDRAKVGNLYTHDPLYNIRESPAAIRIPKHSKLVGRNITTRQPLLSHRTIPSPPSSRCAFIRARKNSATVLETLFQFLIMLQVPKSNCVIRRVSALRHTHL